MASFIESFQWKRFILQFAAKNILPPQKICRQKKFPREYFLAADEDVYIIEGHKNLKSFISLLLIQK